MRMLAPMSDMDFAEYSRVHRHFLTDWLPPLLEQEARRRPATTMVDLGSGDGTMLSGLKARGLLPPHVYAVDLSPDRVRHAAGIDGAVTGVVADAADVAWLPSAVADAVISSQVIEHVPDDAAMVAEIARLVRPGGWWYLGSVLRGRGAWWVYRRDGRWVLDPTHVREYDSREAFCDTLRHPDLVVERLRTEPFRFPVSDLLVRAAVRARALSPDALPGLYDARGGLSRRVRELRVRIPGYRLIEAVGRRR